MNPKTLYVIYHEIMKIRMGLYFFRVRDTKTLMDYLICNHKMWSWDHENKPKIMMGLLLQPSFKDFYTLPCHEEGYALLSNSNEVDYLRMMGKDLIQGILQRSYKGL